MLLHLNRNIYLFIYMSSIKSDNGTRKKRKNYV